MNYKYHCRPCPPKTRERCIQECNQSPSVKLMMLRAFEVGRDSQEMWDRLHMNCLLELRDQEAKAPRSSLLGRRLRKQPDVATSPEETQESITPPPSTFPSAPPLPTIRLPESEKIERPTPPRIETRERRKRVKEEETAPLRYCLVLQNGKHRIGLPVNGEIVLGRFDTAVNMAPDVDLSYDDRENFAISRRHARVIGRDGRHDLEDMGSTNGTKVNGIKLRVGQKTRLRPGDRIGLGYCEFIYSPLPEQKASPRDASPEAYLWSTFTGQRFSVPAWGEAIIGRSDEAIGLVPDIDLSQTEEAAQVVARRHAKVVARSGRHYLEDLGAASGTQVNGVRIRLNEQRLLNPGDHIWLGGCVLAYDVEH